MSNQTFRFLSSEDVKKCLSMAQAIELMKDAFIQLSSNVATVPVRQNLPLSQDEGTALFMPVYFPNRHFGVKVVSIMDNNPSKDLPLVQSMVMILDSKTGQPLALMDGEHLTALRTGAASGLATDLLARKEAEVVAIFGVGFQARFQLEGVCEVRNIKQAYILNRTREKAEGFSKEMSEKLSLPIEVADSNSVLSEVDIICTATSSSESLFNQQDLKPGTHINAIGSFKPEMCEVPAETVRQAKVVVDQRVACLEEAGDIIQALRQGFFNIHAEIGDICAGYLKGRENEDEITLFKSVGNAVQDLAAATQVLENANDLGLGTELSLK